MNALIFVHKLWTDYEPLLREDRARQKVSAARPNGHPKTELKDEAFTRETPVPPSATVTVRSRKANRG
jgi:hypothetical protein